MRLRRRRDEGCIPIPGETQNLHIKSNVQQSDVALHFNMSLNVVTRNDSGSIWTVRGKVDKVPLGVPEKVEDLLSCSLHVYGQPRPPEITVDQTTCDYNKSIVINVTLTDIVNVNGILFSMLQKNCTGDTFEYLCMISIKNDTCNSTEECICVRKAHNVFEVKLKRFVEPSSYVLKTELRNPHTTNTFYENICTLPCSNITKSVGLEVKLEVNNGESTYTLIGSTIGGGMVLIGVIIVAVLVKLKGKAKCNPVNTSATSSDKSRTPTDSSHSYIDVVEDHETHENPYDEIVDSSTESNSDRNRPY
ncbi:uncharacterized protein LOC131939942 [Physella acuta]|uniref:uncharacterized protein LOC131939942 n=1 Tax=Physella acuta TaxID=109671 RepID=UPI0027DBB717|nr:uncharacterized protein LOC131939942 [Physella acuta]